ncbi:unnamed protein product [Triticum turgidum subsp. durum]|uniref:BLOC-1-related complex subunit 6 C-terminal helix domain-containing protein n=1 Tax=Triticum turgidum subsp. durum TaxID=4567 RepID=A0A9R1NSG1_TRITD|nr:unnamed protein product [Triticum turgidum subsp. durum]
MEAVERDAAAIAESYASLFASLRITLSNVTSTSADNMECLGEVVGRLQESGEDVSTSTKLLELNEEMRGLESLRTSDEIYIHQVAVTFEEATDYCKSEVACTSNGEVFLFHDMTKFSQLFDFIVLRYVYLGSMICIC